MLNMDDLKDKLKDKEYREYLAKHMVSPRRCGGLYYYEGKGLYKAGLHFVPAEIYQASQDELDNWFESHDHTHCEFLWSKLMRVRIRGSAT